jgi:hypothetical protein
MVVLHTECVQNDPLCLKPERFTQPLLGDGFAPAVCQGTNPGNSSECFVHHGPFA